MKPFEERYTAWLDGRLTGPELTAFEQSLPAADAAEADKLELQRMQRLLQTHRPEVAFTNGDFFNHQLQQRITADQPAHTSTPRRESARSMWPLSRLAWAGAFCLLTAAVLYKTLIPSHHAADEGPYVAEIFTTQPADPSIQARVVYAPEDRVTVIWLEGLEYLPASYQLEN
jgi:anti-sigma factor RsiW